MQHCVQGRVQVLTLDRCVAVVVVVESATIYFGDSAIISKRLTLRFTNDIIHSW